YQQLREINGSFAVTEPSETVRRILSMTRLSGLLVLEAAGAAIPDRPVPPSSRTLEAKDAIFQALEHAPRAAMGCSTIGDPELMGRCGYRAEHARKVAFPEGAVGIGLGAFGDDFEDCRGRFGEFLAVAGAAAYLPTDGTNATDYMVSQESFVPEV